MQSVDTVPHKGLRSVTSIEGFKDASAGSIARLNSCSFDSNQSFNSCARMICSELSPSSGEDRDALAQFPVLLTEIQQGSGSNTIKTSWGGVYITKRKDPDVEKFLVVKGKHYLAFEKHERKEETLTVREGRGVLLISYDSKSVTVHEVTPGFRIDIAPGVEHCLLALTDLLVFETSKDYKGMDKDLIFLYTPE